MHNQSYYWYGSDNSQAFCKPEQAIPTRKKTKDWWKDNMDWLEEEGIRQYYQNQPIRDIFKSMEGQNSYTALSELVPTLGTLEEYISDKGCDIPELVRHYDLLGFIINVFVGEWSQNPDKFHVEHTDKYAENEYLRQQKDSLFSFANDRLNQEIELKLAQQGYDIPGKKFQNEEERQAFVAEIQKKREELTPESFKKAQGTTFRTQAADWGSGVIESDSKIFSIEILNEESLRHYYASGKTFRHIHIGFDYYKPENWHPGNTFHSQSPSLQRVEDGEYVGRVHFFSKSEFVSRYGHHFSEKDLTEIINEDTSSGRSRFEYGKNKSEEWLFGENFHEKHALPYKNYYDREYIRSQEARTGQPLGNLTYFSPEGEERTVPSFHSGNFGEALGAYSINKRLIQDLRPEMNFDSDLLQVVEAYWISYKKMGLLTYVTSTGRVEQEWVTDELLPEFKRQNGISSIRTLSLADAQNELSPNTIVYTYVPEVCKGYKANSFSGPSSDPLYFGMEPLSFQIKGEGSDLYNHKLPVVGTVSPAPANRIRSYLNLFDLAMNQMVLEMQKEIGKVLLFDTAYLMSHLKGNGDAEEALYDLATLGRDIGFIGVDGSVQNLEGKSTFNQFSSPDLSRQVQIQSRMQVAQMAKNMVFELIGMSGGRSGAPSKHETATGVQISNKASYAQTDAYLSKFSDFLQRFWNMNLSVAQFMERNNKDTKRFYTRSDMSTAWVKISDPKLPLLKLGVMATSSTASRRTLQELKQGLATQNTLFNNPLEYAKVLTADTTTELIDSVVYQRKQQQQREDDVRQQEMAQIERQGELQREAVMFEHELKEDTNEKDRINKTLNTTITAVGRAADNNADQASFDAISKQSEFALKTTMAENDREIKNAKLEVDKQKNADEFRIKLEELKIRMAEIKAQENGTRGRTLVAAINT